MWKNRAEYCPLGFVAVMSVGCSFFTGLGRSSVSFVEAHGFCDFPRGLHELPAFAIKIGCQNVNCRGYFADTLKSPATRTKRPSQRYAHTEEVYGHDVFKSACLPSLSALPRPTGRSWGPRSCRLRRLLLLPRYLEGRWSSCSFRATGANQGEGGKQDINVHLDVLKAQLLGWCPVAAALV